MKQRNAGIDFLKIISMLMIITLHILGKGGVLGVANSFTVKGELIWLLEIFCYCSANCYALASGYTGVLSNHSKINHIIYLWLQVLFYSVLGEVIYIFCNSQDPISIINIIKSFMPVITSKYWYFTAYFGIYMFMPLFKEIVKNVNKNILKRSFISFLFIFCILSSFQNIETIGLKDGYSLLWLSCLYLVGAYLKEFEVFKKYKGEKLLLWYFICSLLVWISKITIGLISQLIFGEIKLDTIFVDYNNILIVFSSIFLLGFFVKMPISNRYNMILKKISMFTFGVYIIHLTPVIYELFERNFAFLFDYNMLVMIILIILSSLVIFTVCVFVDYVRYKLFDLLRIDKICLFIGDKIERIMNILIVKI